MADAEELFKFENPALVKTSPQQLLEGHLAVADSWLVEDGRVRHLQEHYDRFTSWAIEIAEREDYTEFCRAVTAATPIQGRWFPRIELLANTNDGSSQLVFRLREAPDQIETMTLWSYSEPDPRVNPTVKGPDLSLGLQMRRAAQMHGADEAVILNSEGYILEGALSAIVWFRDEVLCAPGDELPWIPSITRMEIFAIAEQMGLSTRTEKVKPADLVGLEVWGLSSLHGIRPVTEWIDLGGPTGQPRHLEAFNKRLRMLSTSIN
jgi:branched-subunit amino acid aminotransferase/4-amino-4-deoxychorismate lyase